VLDRVLGFLAGPQHVPAEREDLAVVAVVDRLERVGSAGADERDQLLVAGDPWLGAAPGT
jgi:hypothetical protein